MFRKEPGVFVRLRGLSFERPFRTLATYTLIKLVIEDFITLGVDRSTKALIRVMPLWCQVASRVVSTHFELAESTHFLE